MYITYTFIYDKISNKENTLNIVIEITLISNETIYSISIIFSVI